MYFLYPRTPEDFFAKNQNKHFFYFCCPDFRMHLYRTQTRECTHSKMFWCVCFLLAIFGSWTKHGKNLHFCTLIFLFFFYCVHFNGSYSNEDYISRNIKRVIMTSEFNFVGYSPKSKRNQHAYNLLAFILDFSSIVLKFECSCHHHI